MIHRKISNALKHIFIPHEGNNYKPHFFRELAIGISLTLSIFLFLASAGTYLFLQSTLTGASISASVLVDLANETRALYNKPLLTRSEVLDKAATLKGEDMVLKGYFSHDSPEGVTPWHWFNKVGYTFLFAGENLAVNFTQSANVNNAWLNSPKHRENLLSPDFREIGIATTKGTYNDKPTIFVVQMFGTPATLRNSISKDLDAFSFVSQEEINKAQETTSLMNINSATDTPLQMIINTPLFAFVKNTADVVSIEPTTKVTYAPWYGKLLFNSGNYVDTLYKLFIGIIVIALILMICIEVRRQHYKHIFYGVLLIVITMILISLNQSFIN